MSQTRTRPVARNSRKKDSNDWNSCNEANGKAKTWLKLPLMVAFSAVVLGCYWQTRPDPKAHSASGPPNAPIVEAEFTFARPTVEAPRFYGTSAMLWRPDHWIWNALVNPILRRLGQEQHRIKVRDVRNERPDFNTTGFVLLNAPDVVGATKHNEQKLENLLRRIYPGLTEVRFSGDILREISPEPLLSKAPNPLAHLDFHPDHVALAAEHPSVTFAPYVGFDLDFLKNFASTWANVHPWRRKLHHLFVADDGATYTDLAWRAPPPAADPKKAAATAGTTGFTSGNETAWAPFGGRRYVVLGIWRPHDMTTPVCDWPLALTDARSLRPEALTPLLTNVEFAVPELGAAIRVSAISASLRHDQSQEWVYFSNMTQDEVLVFTHYSSHEYFQNAHSAFYQPNCDGKLYEPRKSFDTRALVFLD